MIPRLPHWVLTDRNPAFYDSESKTCIEMVAKIYAKMQELVDHYNEFVDPLNKEIADFYKELKAEYECFKASMIKICHDYIMTMDEKIKMQDLMIKQYYESFVQKLTDYEKLINYQFTEFTENVNGKINLQDETIQDAVNYMKTNIKETTEDIANELLQRGDINIQFTYFTTDKKLLLTIPNGGLVYDEENKQVSIVTGMEV